MKTIRYIAGIVGLLAIAAGCAKEQESIAPTPVAVEEPASSAVPGMIRLKRLTQKGWSLFLYRVS